MAAYGVFIRLHSLLCVAGEALEFVIVFMARERNCEFVFVVPCVESVDDLRKLGEFLGHLVVEVLRELYPRQVAWSARC